ncbi:hypothetical protein ACFWZ2_04435 [Streptomyces sp. NPDC059002]|uniref:hypothetical protein n=1 Tax=Streptomyces sp. NPDC059002 TaxID=3346690 RepID=UPI0036C4E83D
MNADKIIEQADKAREARMAEEGMGSEPYAEISSDKGAQDRLKAMDEHIADLDAEIERDEQEPIVTDESDESTALRDEIASLRMELARRDVRDQFGWQIADLATGDDPDSFRADAERLGKLTGSATGGLGKGGLDPNEAGNGFDAVAAIREAGR